jgi:hypothetical protein
MRKASSTQVLEKRPNRWYPQVQALRMLWQGNLTYLTFASPHHGLTSPQPHLKSSLISPSYHHNHGSLKYVSYMKKMHLDEVNPFRLSVLSFVWCILQFRLKAIWSDFVKFVAHGPPFKISFGE